MRNLFLGLALVASVASCHDDPLAPPGSVRIQITTTGVDPDTDYEIRAAGRSYAATAVDTVVLKLRPGTRQISLEGVASNCFPSGGKDHSVEVTSGSTTATDFFVICVAVTGAVAITATISGSDVDPDGFTVQVGSTAPRSLANTDSIVVDGLGAGDYSVTLSGMAANCTAAGPNPRIVHVTVGGALRDTVRTTFAVTCAGLPGNVRVVAQTTGVDLDPDGYTVYVITDPWGYEETTLSVPANGSATAVIPSGDRLFHVGGIAGNCVLTGASPRNVRVVAGVTTDVVLMVTCTTSTHLAVFAQTTGVDPDQNGYRITATAFGTSNANTVTANGTVTFGPLPAATYTVTLTDLAANCEVAGDATLTVVATGNVQVTFAVICTSLQTIAYTAVVSGNYDIYSSKADGSGVQRLTSNPDIEVEPDWSSSGRIAFRRSQGNNDDIHVMNADGSAQTRLTTHAQADRSPAWSPDGTRIAFVSYRDGNAEIYLMDANGSNIMRLTDHPSADFDPAWSPDGTRIAFVRGTCDSDACHGNIHLINPDGLGLTPLTDASIDGQPAWSPDGTKIAFARANFCANGVCERDIVVMSATGTDVTLLPSDGYDESEPSWSPTGSRLMVALASCGDYYYYYGLVCTPSGLRIMRPDGTDPAQIVTGYVSNPVWRR